MVVGFARIKLGLPGVSSLKEKRGVVRSLVERARHKFNAAVAEVGDNDLYERAEIGLSVVGNDSSFVNSMLDKVLDAIEDDAIGRANVLDTELELIHV